MNEEPKRKGVLKKILLKIFVFGLGAFLKNRKGINPKDIDKAQDIINDNI